MIKRTGKPFILVCNDDGVTAPGIQALTEVARKFGDVMVVAPDKPQSGTGHGITINSTLRINTIKEEEGLSIYSASGTPVDCIKLAMYKLGKTRPDLIVSGINHGSNASINVIYSGTMSAAVEGALEGVPSIGFSLMDFSIDADFTASQKIAETLISKALENEMGKGICLNVNIPKLGYDEIMGIKVCRQAEANWEEEFEERTDPFGKKYYWLTGEFVSHDKGEDTDVWALNNNYVSVVPVQYDLTAHRFLNDLNAWDF